MKREDVLERARVCVCGEREHDYGEPEDNFGTIGKLWTVYLGASHPELKPQLEKYPLSGVDVATMMALLKVARIAAGSTEDSFVDLAGYAACGGEIFSNENHDGESVNITTITSRRCDDEWCP